MKIRKTILLAGLVVLGLAFVLGCSDDDDPVVIVSSDDITETIGTAGGSIELAGEFTLTIPENALDDDVEFTLADAGSDHAAMVAVRSLASAVYSIGPSGTTFDEPVQLVLHYDEEDLGGAAEADIVIYTDSGSGWEELATVVDEVNNTATANITHLSDFAVTVPVAVEPDDVYAVLDVSRQFSDVAGVTVTRTDAILARFDEVVAVAPDTPLQAETATLGTWALEWDGDSYSYFGGGTAEFLDLDTNYDFVVVGNEAVSSLTIPVETVAFEPYVTNLESMEEVPLAGFTLEWNGADAGSDVNIVISGAGETGLDITVPNSGTYTFTGTELDDIDAGEGSVNLYWNEELPITADGFLAGSHVQLSTANANSVVFTREAVIVENTWTSTPSLTIPDKPAWNIDSTPVTDNISVAANGTVANVWVYLDVTHASPSDLIIKLTSPDGTQLTVYFIGESGGPATNIQAWYPGDYEPKDDLSGFAGDSVSGDWTLTAQDYSEGAGGVLNEWRLRISYEE